MERKFPMKSMEKYEPFVGKLRFFVNKKIAIESKDPKKKHQAFQALPTCSRSISTELPALFVGCATSPGEHATDRADPWPQNMTKKNDENCQVSQFSSEKTT